MGVLSGVITNNFATYYFLQLEWSGTQKISDNTTTITARLYIGGQNIISSANKTAKIIIDGKTYTTTTARIAKASGEKKLIYTVTKTIAHNPDGSKRISVGGSCGVNATLSGIYYGTVNLQTRYYDLEDIPRISMPTLSNPNPTLGNTITVYTNRASSSFTHTIRYAFNGASGTIATGVTTSTTWTLPLSLANRIPNSTSGTGYIYCDTYSGSKKIGTADVKFTAKVPSDIVPDFDEILHIEYIPEVASVIGEGKYIQGMSRIFMEIIGAEGAYSSTIKSYSITFDGATHNSRTALSEIVRNSGQLTITAKVTDSRGRTATKTATVEVLPYSPPQITAFSLQRCDADGTPNMLGEYVKVKREGYVSSLLNVTEKNTLTYRIRSKQRDATSWTLVKSQTLTSLTLAGNEIIGTYSVTSSYDFRFEITDVFNTTFVLDVLPTGKVVMSWDNEGVGIGKVREQGVLDVLGEIYGNAGGLDGLVPVVESGSYSNGSYIKWSNGLQICWGSNTFPGEGWTGSGDKWYLTGQSLTFPVTFDSNPTFLGTTQDAAIAARSAKLASFNVRTSGVISMSFNGWGTASGSFQLRWLAIGWWKELEES